MRRYIPLLAALAAIITFSKITSAVVTVTTDPVGFTTTSLLGSSDTYVSIPFTRMPEFTGAIQSIAGSVITVSGSPGWSNNQFAGTQKYYALIGGGGSLNPKEGHTYFVSGNGSNTLTVTTTPTNDLTNITPNTQIVLIPYWTLATVFPASDANVSFTPTTSTSSYKTQIQMPNDSAPSITYSPVYFFSNNVDGTPSNVGWRVVGDNTTDHGNDPLSPDSFFIVRNQSGAPTLPLTVLGSVLLKKFSAPVMTSTSPYDNAVSILRPLDVALNATGLSSVFGPNDQLFLFNNAVATFPKTPSATYVYDTHWRLSGDALSDRGADVIPTGAGFIVRKAATNNATAFWTNAFPVTAISAVSRKMHGTLGPFDIPLPLSGTPGIECRMPGNTPAGTGVDYQIVFTFPTAVTFNNPNTANGAMVTSGAGSVVSTSGNTTTTLTVNLTGVTNQQRITLTLLGVNDGTNANDVATRIGVLLGDTNGNGAVNNSDITQTKGQSGVLANPTNFRTDVNVNGAINNSDITTVKGKSGTGLPPP